jgi:phage I-like protein
MKQRGLKTLADLPSLPAGPKPTSRIVVARLGTYKDSRYGVFSISEKDFQGWSSRLADTFGGKVAIDLDHSAEKGRGTAAAGWITGLELQGKDVIADVSWTRKGAEAVRDETYRHISPSFTNAFVDEHGKNRGRALLGAALTNRPFLRSLPTVSLSRDSYDGVAVPTKKGKSMKSKKQLARKAERKAKKKLQRKADKAVRMLAEQAHTRQLAAAVQPGLSPASPWGDPTAVQAPGFG